MNPFETYLQFEPMREDEDEIRTLVIPFNPWQYSKIKKRKETNCCVWLHLEDGFTIRIHKTGTQMWFYHEDSPLEDTEPVVHLQSSLEMPANQEEYDDKLRLVETIVK